MRPPISLQADYTLYNACYQIKEDMGFRQYLYRGKENVLVQSVLTAIAHNINKLHFKIQGGRTGRFLTDLKTA